MELSAPATFYVGSLEVVGLSHQGMVREQNEDRWRLPSSEDLHLEERGYLFAVADGMGGYGGGELASSTTLDTLYAQFYGAQAVELPEAIQAANMAVRRLAMQADHDARMGTTLVAAWFFGEQLLVAHVGDSRAYIVSHGTIQPITQDHSVVQEQVRAGLLTPAQAAAQQGKNVITRAIGNQSPVEVDYTPVTGLQAGDTVMLCSDGLTNFVADHEIAHITTAYPLAMAAAALVNLANQRGGSDNITVLIMRLQQALLDQPQPAETSALAPTLRLRREHPLLWSGLTLLVMLLVAAGTWLVLKKLGVIVG